MVSIMSGAEMQLPYYLIVIITLIERIHKAFGGCGTQLAGQSKLLIDTIESINLGPGRDSIYCEA